MMLLCSVLLFSVLVGHSTEDVITPFNDTLHVTEGDNVTLSCNYSGSPYSLQWYRQYPRSAPEFLVLIFETAKTSQSSRPRMSTEVNKDNKRVDLELSSTEVTDSAVYYCALNPNDAARKLIFGEGTRLIIQTKAPGEPSFYKLGEGNNTVCLATGFNKYKALDKLELFSKYNETGPTRIPNEPFFDKAVILEEDEECPNATDDDDISCRSDFKGLFETDENINFLSLTVLGLRFLFLKSILFNVLMTIRALSR